MLLINPIFANIISVVVHLTTNGSRSSLAATLRLLFKNGSEDSTLKPELLWHVCFTLFDQSSRIQRAII